jgi:hypothetical protein
MVQV